ncbi:MAG TPA: DUF2334 domain-containing protein [Steroidobacteraceae bacterium]
MKILLRLDDYTPNCNRASWEKIEQILDRLQIRPLVAVIPEDRYFGTAPSDEAFWESVRQLQGKRWSIALHGHTHLVTPVAAGAAREIFFATKSEFVGRSQAQQLATIELAWQEFVRHGVRPDCFVAPNHGFDAATVRALSQHGAMRIISDGIALRPFKDRDLAWIPQLDWRMPRWQYGFRTVCLHPSTMRVAEIDRFEIDARRMRAAFVELQDIDTAALQPRGVGDAVFAKAFAAYFRVKEALHRLRASRTHPKSPASSVRE